MPAMNVYISFGYTRKKVGALEKMQPEFARPEDLHIKALIPLIKC